MNGALVRLVSICYDDETASLNNSINLLKKMPKYLVIELVKPNKNRINITSLAENTFPIFPSKKSFQIKNPNNAKKHTIYRTQFPLTYSFAITAHKAQSRTIDKIIVDLAQVPTGSKNGPYAYVSCSRARKFDDILILRDFHFKVLNYKRSDDFKVEEERLLKLEAKTI